MRLRRLSALCLAAALAAPGVHAQQAPSPSPAVAVPLGQPIEARHLAPHRAAYRLSLSRVRDAGNISRADGAMLYEMVDACDGWASRQRFTLTLTDRDGTEIETSSDYATYETKDGRRLRFTLTQTTQGAVTQRIAGEAEIGPDGAGTVPLGEASEAYEIDVLDAPGGAVVRTIAGLASPSAVYTAADQTADFGAPQSLVHVAVFQLSAAVGRGFPATASL